MVSFNAGNFLNQIQSHWLYVLNCWSPFRNPLPCIEVEALPHVIPYCSFKFSYTALRTLVHCDSFFFFVCVMRDLNLVSFFCWQMFSILSITCWRCSIFSNGCYPSHIFVKKHMAITASVYYIWIYVCFYSIPLVFVSVFVLLACYFY